MEAFTVISKGIYTTVQDLGRIGYRNYGVPVSGALDKDAMINANRLVGNDDNAPCLEILASGLCLKAMDDFQIALTGGEVEATLDEIKLEQNKALNIKKNQVIKLQRMISGIRTYLAVSGGFSSQLMMGSRSVNEKILMGKSLMNGDVINRNQAILPVSSKPLIKRKNNNVFQVILGPDLDKFTKAGIQTFLKSEFTVSEKLDRMGIRLNGDKIELDDHADVVSHPVVYGSIQVPDDGNPIILMADCQTTGGYAVIGTIRNKDISQLGQLKSGDKIRFRK
ncbi:MAG: biotin-dependent carboxyltransferase family protein [Clostridia bacterium]|nr:biotin-dependent carboxyltransferase family protein [Clostridia bacterium]